MKRKNSSEFDSLLNNSDEDPNILELDFSKMDLNKGHAFPIPVKSNLPKHIDDVLETELSSLMNSIKVICLKDIHSFEEIRPIFELNIKISLITEIKNNFKYLKDLTKRKQINSSKSIIADYLFNVNMVIALATGNKEKIAELMKFNRRKYNEDDFRKAQELSHKKQVNYDDALVEVYEKNPNSQPELKDKGSLVFYSASIAFRQWRSRINKKM